MSTLKVDTIDTTNSSGNITVSRPLSGSGASLTALNATNLASGTVATARLGSGTANNTVFLRGDGTWATAGSTSASDLTSGTLPDGRFPATLPAASGVNLTALNATQLTSGTIPIARIADDAVTNAKMADDAIGVAQLSASGTASSSTFLRGDNAWAAAGGGAWEHILTVDASNVGNVDFDSGTATYTMSDYSCIVFVLKHVYGNTSAQILRCQDSTNNGSSYLGNYAGGVLKFDTDGTLEYSGNTAGSSNRDINYGDPFSSGAGGVNYAFSGTLWQPSNQGTATRNQHMRWEGAYGDGGDDTKRLFGFSFTADTVDSGGIDAWRFLMSSGNISGRFSMYGIKDS